MSRIQINDTMPDFAFNTAFNNHLHLSQVAKGKTILWALRYIGCTVCRYDVHMIAKRYSEFLEKGAQVYVIMQSDQKHVQNDLASTNTTLPFEIICDPEMKIYNMLEINPAESMEALADGVLDQLKEKASKAREAGFSHGDYEGNEQQLPAMFIVDEDRKVLYAHYAENIMDMPSIDEILEKI